jgi:hypothetical protein
MSPQRILGLVDMLSSVRDRESWVLAITYHAKLHVYLLNACQVVIRENVQLVLNVILTPYLVQWRRLSDVAHTMKARRRSFV